MPQQPGPGLKLANLVITALLSVISITGGLSAKMISGMADDIRELKSSMKDQGKQLGSRMTMLEKRTARIERRNMESAIHWEYR